MSPPGFHSQWIKGEHESKWKKVFIFLFSWNRRVEARRVWILDNSRMAVM